MALITAKVMMLQFIFVMILGVTAQIRNLDRYGFSSQFHDADMSICAKIS